MNHPAPSKISRLGDLPRDIRPPHDGWPVLEAKLRASGTARPELAGLARPARRWQPRTVQLAALAAALAAVALGISIDRWFLGPAPLNPSVAARGDMGAGGEIPVAYVTDPRYLRARAALLRSLDAQLAKLPAPTRKKVLVSLATIHQSMQQLQQALGREPGNALLQELLIDTYQNEMQVLSTVQQASDGSGET